MGSRWSLPRHPWSCCPSWRASKKPRTRGGNHRHGATVPTLERKQPGAIRLPLSRTMHSDWAKPSASAWRSICRVLRHPSRSASQRGGDEIIGSVGSKPIDRSFDLKPACCSRFINGRLHQCPKFEEPNGSGAEYEFEYESRGASFTSEPSRCAPLHCPERLFTPPWSLSRWRPIVKRLLALPLKVRWRCCLASTWCVHGRTKELLALR